ncbi:MAG TPA: PTS transporter subunit EIIC [Clostridia bacterium]|nr:PTS transporter subunit EIIC [Clostridia bacterium]
MSKEKFMSGMQKFGKALMTPVAVLPAAAILLRLGSADAFNIPWMAAAGGAIFSNLSIIFAIGIAIGLAKDNHGVAAIAAAVGYFVLTTVAASFDSSINMGILSGIISGLLAAFLYNKYKNIKVPDILGFFGGKRFVPIITSFYSLLIGIMAGFVWPLLQSGIDKLGNAIVASGTIGVFFYGFLNRLLLPFGLHHVLNTLVCFQFGTFIDAAGKTVTGDLTRFFAGDPNGGMFMAGGYVVCMFGLPAVCLAMVMAAKKQNRKAVTGILLSAALTSFLTGITEPIEFVFMFISPVLLFVHAVLMGLFDAVAAGLGIRMGVGFSNGLIDYVLTFQAGTKPLLIVLLGIAAALLYYFIFYFAIKKFNIPTPGRLDEEESTTLTGLNALQLAEKAKEMLEAIGRKENIGDLDACITRIRLTVKDETKVDEERIKKLGATGIMKLGSKSYQIVVGTVADPLVSHMKELSR